MCILCQLGAGLYGSQYSHFADEYHLSAQQSIGRQQAAQLQTISQQELARVLGALSQNAMKPKPALKRWVSNPLERAVIKGESYMIGSCKVVEIKSLR